MTGPSVSVIMPAHNAARFIGEAIRSVLDEAYEPLELIVIDDGSTDDTAAIAESFGSPVTVVRQPNRGPGGARNTGLQVASGDVVGFLDADDLWPAGSVQRRLDVLADNGGAGVVMGRTRLFVTRLDEHGTRIAFPYGDPLYGAFLSACFVAREAVGQVGLFDESLAFSEDYDLVVRLRESGAPLTLIDEVTHLYRRHDANMTIGVDGDTSLHHVLKRSLDRRRGAAADPDAAQLPDVAYRGEGELGEGERPRLRLLDWERP